MRKIAILCLLVSLLIHNQAITQHNELTKIESLNISLKERDLRKIERARRTLVSGYENAGLARVNADMHGLGKAGQEIASSTRVYFEIYQVYAEDFWSKNRRVLAPEVERAKEFERRAAGHFQQAEFLREEAPKQKEFELSVNLFAMAAELELLGLLNLARAIRVYQDFPVIYAYEWEDDVEIPRESPERVARVIAFQQDTESGSETGMLKTVEQTPDISFIVQIAAHTISMDESYLRTIYRGKQVIQMVFEEPWYKYYLGPYKSVEEAQRVLEVVNVKNAFIAAYEDDRRINVRDAVARLSNP
jgi:hypothetical protein